ncbi:MULTISPECIES: hypothetical protein [Kitasatospora]
MHRTVATLAALLALVALPALAAQSAAPGGHPVVRAAAAGDTTGWE